MNQNDNKKIYVVETVSIFRHTYYIRAKNESDALDEFYWSKATDSFIEGSQKHLDEIHTGAREVTEEQFLKEFDDATPYLAHLPVDEKLTRINEIDYNEK